ncbi:dihydrofolate reductase family protein [Kibdelosporangium phytohabitans]|uniref:Bacterial bifunctional deaminase-reductase C-terminal domain-containing protein n=1 Tax=Kibdelosporangium phytohabitans TaxID=860235 RepID=A0A0N9HYS7_9PSEU|nr:dihydrofolate reductase family protein [Kibdelosporangium phytohabitans]ALG10744.1 hypothetical protein AOZ06_31075 [Kibdelosporangium phytohabitans]MBE1461891.1 dihydrofolate reductase [Kibdelosporangium phytohabitans]
MRNLVLYMQQTLNGFGTDPGDQMEWIKISEETWEFTYWIHQTCDAVVLGRKVYEDFLTFWPDAAKDESDSDLARHARWFKDVKKYVVSSTLTETDPAWPNTEILGDVEAIKPIKEQDGKNLVIFGGIDVLNSFAKAGLIDDYYLHVNPSAIPEGRLLIDTKVDLELADVKTHKTGTVVVHYTRG